jgi:hypothetical protein
MFTEKETDIKRDKWRPLTIISMRLVLEIVIAVEKSIH